MTDQQFVNRRVWRKAIVLSLEGEHERHDLHAVAEAESLCSEQGDAQVKRRWQSRRPKVQSARNVNAQGNPSQRRRVRGQ